MTPDFIGGHGGSSDLPTAPSRVERRHEGRVFISIGLSVRERHFRSRPEKLLDHLIGTHGFRLDLPVKNVEAGKAPDRITPSKRWG